MREEPSFTETSLIFNSIPITHRAHFIMRRHALVVTDVKIKYASDEM